MNKRKDSPGMDTVQSYTELQFSPKTSRITDFLRRRTCNDVWRFLLFFRCVNAVLIQTFFQPDEFYQSLEPAWEMAFGAESGAWITWEWRYGLRSSLHPLIFATAYFAADKLMKYAACSPSFRAMVLTMIPSLIQGYIAAIGEFYTWQLSKKIYGRKSNVAWVTLFLSVLSPWQWLCSTRTFSNSLEMSLTITALNFWPWELLSKVVLNQTSSNAHKGNPNTNSDSHKQLTDRSIKELRFSLLLAGTASILRPTNLLIWLSTLAPYASLLLSRPHLISLNSINRILLREFLICSSLVLLVSAISDRQYYRDWIFPPYRWLHFNIIQDLAVFYGQNNWHYYLSEGLPQLLTTYLPFTLLGICRASSLPSGDIRVNLTVISLFSIVSLSLISHKEVRFIYPLLPLLLILTAPNITQFLISCYDQKQSANITTKRSTSKPNSPYFKISRLFLLITLFVINVFIAFYFSTIHQSGALAVIPYIRRSFEKSKMRENVDLLKSKDNDNDSGSTPYLAILMPCHSTPFRSVLVHSELTAWALTCSPPLDIPPRSQARANYRDEADRFYEDPARFLRQELGLRKDREWPHFVVGFEGIEKALKDAWESEGGKSAELVRKKRFFNSHWHEDYRRKGDIFVWELVRGQT